MPASATKTRYHITNHVITACDNVTSIWNRFLCWRQGERENVADRRSWVQNRETDEQGRKKLGLEHDWRLGELDRWRRRQCERRRQSEFGAEHQVGAADDGDEARRAILRHQKVRDRGGSACLRSLAVSHSVFASLYTVATKTASVVFCCRLFCFCFEWVGEKSEILIILITFYCTRLRRQSSINQSISHYFIVRPKVDHRAAQLSLPTLTTSFPGPVWNSARGRFLLPSMVPAANRTQPDWVSRQFSSVPWKRSCSRLLTALGWHYLTGQRNASSF